MRPSVIFNLASTLVTAASAQYVASVVNDCAFSIYVQSFPNDQNGANPGPLHTLASGQKYTENYVMDSAGSAIKIGTRSALAAPLTFGYTPSNSLVYYDLSNNAGNPLKNQRNSLEPATKSCPGFDCAAGDASCYSNSGSIKVEACQLTSLIVTVCAPS